MSKAMAPRLEKKAALKKASKRDHDMTHDKKRGVQMD